MIPWRFDFRLFCWLSLAFILCTIIGTVSHEFGHYIVAELMGYDATIHYGSTSVSNTVDYRQVSSLSPIWITIGGPVQTMLTGTFGLLILWLSRRSFNQTSDLSYTQWFFIFLSLFWLRFPANLATWILGYLRSGRLGLRGDEIGIARYFKLPDWSIVVLTAIIGFLILTIIIFRIIPKHQRFTFIISGLVGGIAGYVLWLYLIGKYILP